MIETLFLKIKAIIGALVVSMTLSSPITLPVVVQDTVQDVVQVVEVATSTATTTPKKITIVVETKPTVTYQEEAPPKQDSPVVVATSSVTTETLPKPNTEIVTSAPVYVPPTVQVVQVTAYVPQQEVVTAPIPSQSMAQTYTIKKGEEIIASTQTEAQVRSFASDLNNYINWKKKMQSNALKDVVIALQANGYDVPEVNTKD